MKVVKRSMLTIASGDSIDLSWPRQGGGKAHAVVRLLIEPRWVALLLRAVGVQLFVMVEEGESE